MIYIVDPNKTQPHYYVSTTLFFSFCQSYFEHENKLYFQNQWGCTQSKGQIISKGLFGILEFSQKTNERIRFYY